MNTQLPADEHAVISEGVTAVVHQSQVTKALRQVLQNEMGLTAAYVMQEAEKIIEAAVQKAIQKALQEDSLDRFVARHMGAYLATSANTYQSNADRLTAILKAAAEAEAVRVLRERVSIQVKVATP
jgi:CRISPR/Cas system CMR-associated protein Cmr5 small subunit